MKLPDKFPDESTLEREGTSLLGDLIRFDTTNPPGDETACAQYLANWLGKRGLPGRVIESAPGRGNVIARLKGADSGAEPLLLLSHLDVVPAEAADWSVPPFSGEVKDGYVYGRGAIDCKGATAMQALALAGIADSGVELKRDVILAATADEEAGGEGGVEWLLKNRREEFFAPFAINEGGGFSISFRGKTYFTCQTAEKKLCWLNLKSRGEAGHASMPDRDSAMNRMVKALAKLADHRAPVRRESREAIRAMWRLAAGRPGALAARLATTPVVKEWLFALVRNKSARRMLEAITTNTISITIVSGGDKTNVIPSEVNATIDCRLLPGMTHRDMLEDVRKVVGKYGVEAELDVMSEGGLTGIDTELYKAIESAVCSLGPNHQLAPFMVTGATDGRFLVEEGCSVYGFIPFHTGNKADEFLKAMHGVDERLSVENLVFGTRLMADVIMRFCG